MVIPTRDQFRKLVTAIRENDGREDSQQKAKPGADLVELLAYSGCRIAEAGAITWADADFEKNTLTVTGGAIGTKNYESRIVPMTDALRALLLRLHQERNPKPSETISQIRQRQEITRERLSPPRLPAFHASRPPPFLRHDLH